MKKYAVIYIALQTFLIAGLVVCVYYRQHVSKIIIDFLVRMLPLPYGFYLIHKSKQEIKRLEKEVAEFKAKLTQHKAKPAEEVC